MTLSPKATGSAPVSLLTRRADFGVQRPARGRSMTISAGLRAVSLFAGLLLMAGPAIAGPPYVTDDPEPTDPGHWEIYNFVTASHVPGDTAGSAGLDINYGPLKDLQLTAVVPIDFGGDKQAGLGDVELAIKYRFLHQAEDSLTPDVAFFPGLVTPTTSHPVGADRFGLFLPIWAQKDFGKWSLFGGGGYDINPGPENRNFWLTGLGLSRTLTDRFTMGAEIYRQTADTPGGEVFTGLNIGAAYKMTDHWSLLASAGPGIQNPRQGGQYDWYFSLEATY